MNKQTIVESMLPVLMMKKLTRIATSTGENPVTNTKTADRFSSIQ